VVADQCGEIYDSSVCTIVFAKRFAGYKRADLLLNDMDKFHQLVTSKDRPVQIIWAGKPYPMDYAAISIYDKIADLCKNYANCSILSGYELRLTKILKSGADVWLNVPRLTHEACGTSGMSAAMNGAINVALPDGWFPEFAKDNINSFIIPPADKNLPDHEQDHIDANNLFEILENIVLPVYYDHPDQWTTIMKNGLRDIIPRFESKRMAKEYYENLYI
jgi:starch phosphorylase